MARLATPGLKFFADKIDPEIPPTGLYPTMSTYGIPDLEGGPKRNELYIVCQDGSIQSVYEPNRPIGWELIEDAEGFWYRVTQMNHPRKRCAVRFHSRVDAPPAGGGRIGSVVMACRRVDAPQEATIRGDSPGSETDEVTSTVKEYLADFREAAAAVDVSKLTGAEAKIATIDPLLAQCAVILNDPVQTEAMAKFAEGKMSYAEMRGLCG